MPDQDFIDQNHDIETILANTNRWAVSYGDLMSVLMCLFLLLYAFAATNNVEGRKQLEQIQKMFGGNSDKQLMNVVKQINLEESTAKEIRGFIEGSNLSGYAVIKVDDFQIKLMMTQAIMFESGSTSITSKVTPVLDKLAQMLKVMDNRIEIEGHTDDSPGNNFEISVERSLSVMNYLIAKGISPDRIALIGMGSFRPLVPNKNDENRSRNRRVEINILRKQADLLKNS